MAEARAAVLVPANTSGAAWRSCSAAWWRCQRRVPGRGGGRRRAHGWSGASVPLGAVSPPAVRPALPSCATGVFLLRLRYRGGVHESTGPKSGAGWRAGGGVACARRSGWSWGGLVEGGRGDRRRRCGPGRCAHEDRATVDVRLLGARPSAYPANAPVHRYPGTLDNTVTLRAPLGTPTTPSSAAVGTQRCSGPWSRGPVTEETLQWVSHVSLTDRLQLPRTLARA